MLICREITVKREKRRKVELGLKIGGKICVACQTEIEKINRVNKTRIN